MDLLAWVVLGFIAGWATSLILDSDSTQGALLDIGLGVVGALVGGWLLDVFGEPGVTGFNIYSMFVSALGSIVLIWLGRTLRVQA